ncbi:unnamed protein product [Periconia digitata]|uniref:Uncharacterized protein n=1 Tax=Periconia digitata TaxID=1303443 RepID=A0A9W4UHU5_9PLEO|nr:unnamed protein product [Periconia digitata]
MNSGVRGHGMQKQSAYCIMECPRIGLISVLPDINCRTKYQPNVHLTQNHDPHQHYRNH